MKHSILTILFSLIFFNQAATAQTIHKVTVDRGATDLLASVDTIDALRVNITPGNSYCCEIIDPTSNVTFLFHNINIEDTNGTTPIEGRVVGLADAKLRNRIQRLCFIAPTTLSGTSIFADLTFSAVSPATNVPVSCNETTLYGGFNTSVTDFNFLEITSTVDKQNVGESLTINGNITAKNIIPEPDTTVIDQFPFSVTAGSRVDVDIHSRTGFGVFGPVKIAHDGAPGSLKIVLSQYNTTSTTPFDIAPVAQEVFQTRAGLAGGSR